MQGQIRKQKQRILGRDAVTDMGGRGEGKYKGLGRQERKVNAKMAAIGGVDLHKSR